MASFKGDNDRVQVTTFIAPSYQTAHLMVMKGGSDKYRITFAVSPSTLNESRSNNFQTVKTNGGWFAMRLGSQPISLSFSGYMLDTEGYLEKHQFLQNYQNLIEDTRVAGSEYQNEYTVKFVCMGREYYGVINGISISTDASRQFVHTYQISMTCFSDQYIYKPGQAKVSSTISSKSSENKSLTVTRNIFNIISRG